MSSSLKKSYSQDTLRGASTPDIAKTDIYDEGVVDPVYAAKSHVLNRALQEIGMGKYQVSASYHEPRCFAHFLIPMDCAQWGLFAVAGFGWFSYVHSLDSLGIELTSLLDE